MRLIVLFAFVMLSGCAYLHDNDSEIGVVRFKSDCEKKASTMEIEFDRSTTKQKVNVK